MTRILVLDDDPERHDLFARRLRGLGLTHAWTSTEAQSHLSGASGAYPFDVAFLDHDLGQHGIPSIGDGRDVARFIAEHVALERRPVLVVVHSWNLDAAKEMVATLRLAGVRTTYARFDRAMVERWAGEVRALEVRR